MPKDRRPPDSEEIDRIARMARESRDFYKGLAKSLRPEHSRKVADTTRGGSETGQKRPDQHNDGSPA